MNEPAKLSRVGHLLNSSISLMTNGLLLAALFGLAITLPGSWLMLYVLLGVLGGLILLRFALLSLLGKRQTVEYRDPDYQQAESTLMGKFPGPSRPKVSRK